jgi:MHS family proline/betaine transporter-like MFS transporter
MLPIIAGNLFEWFDYTIYGFFATTIAHQFFPPTNPEAAMLAVAATFGVAFVMRAGGSGRLRAHWRRLGRKASLTITFGLMAVGTGLIGFAPTYQTAGVLATAILVFGRLLQGLSASGEVGVSLTLLIESTEPARRGAATGWLQVGVYAALVLGSLAALAVNTLLTPTDAAAWGWRLPSSSDC